MTDIEKIDKFLKTLENYWKLNPSNDFSEVMQSLTPAPRSYFEDTVTSTDMLERAIRKHEDAKRTNRSVN